MRPLLRAAAAALGGALAAAGSAAAADSPADAPANKLAREIYAQLISINTTDSVGNVTSAAEAMAQRFRAAGFAPADIVLVGPNERKKNLIVRLRGTGQKKPLLLMGHLDVVEAPREDWSTDPFKLTEQDGFFYGRGAIDMKNGDAVMVATLIGMKKEGFKPARDIILALTAGEESGVDNGAEWLFAHHRELVDAEFALNQDDWSIPTQGGKPLVLNLIAGGKLYADYQLVVTNSGGHSSEPRPDNAIYALSAGLTRLGAYSFPFELNEVTRAYYAHRATLESGQRAADMRAILRQPADPQAIQRLAKTTLDNGAMRTTCVATRLEGGHANNALPQRAAAVVNCRILPGHSAEEVRQDLIRVLAEPQISVRYIAADGHIDDVAPQARAAPPSPLRPEVLEPLQRIAGEMWPGLQVIPWMDIADSDSVYSIAAGVPTYTFGAVPYEANDDRAHGRNERVSVESFYKDNEFFARYLRAITAP